MKLRQWIYERGIQALCVLVIVGFIYVIYLFLSSLPPPPTTPLNKATLWYMAGNYPEALNILRPLAKEKPDDPDIQYMLGQVLLKNKERREAKALYSELVKRFPDQVDMHLGLAQASEETKDYQTAIDVYKRLVEEHPRDKKLYFLLGETYFKAGENLHAAEVYKKMLENDWQTEEVTKNFLAIYGVPSYDPNMPLGLPPVRRPETTQMNFRTNKDFFEAYEKGKWNSFFWKGMNLTNAAPGYYVANPPTEFEIYAEWLRLIAEMNCNVVRSYILSAPGFYQALKAHNDKHEKKLWLFQEVWLSIRDPQFQAEKEAYNLYDPSWMEEFKREIREQIDAVHGHGDIPKRPGRTGGIYAADVSQYVVGIGLGKELETYIAEETNKLNPTLTSYQGKYISMKEGNPTERWFALMCDYAIDYEMTHYNTQSPITVVNAPQFDSLYHVSDATTKEQNEWEKSLNVPLTPKYRSTFETNLISLDVTKYTAHPNFKAGIFACFHIYPHWPDFMWADPKYAKAKDKWGPNPFWGYITELKEHYKDFPLLMGEYGASTSWYSVYSTVNSIDQGGYTEQEQSDIMVRWTKNIADAKYCGAVVFQMLDEWWHTSVNLSAFMNYATKSLWFNVDDGESNYGVLTYEAKSPIPRLRGKGSDWDNSQKISSSSLFSWSHPGDVKRVYAYSDFAFLYLRLDVEPWENGQWDQKEYWIALSTLPGKFGSQALPGVDLKIESGANFLVRLQPNMKGELLITHNYNPHVFIEQPAVLGNDGLFLARKTHIKQGVEPYSPFEKILLPTQPYHFGRDGTLYPAMWSNLSLLRYGTSDPNSTQFSNLAAWHVDAEKGMIELRIPWMSIYVVDPPNVAVLADLVPRGVDFGTPTEKTPGIGIVALCVDVAQGSKVLNTLPEASSGMISAKKLPLYSWKGWIEAPPYETRLKPLYFSLQKLFKTLNLETKP